MLIRKSNEKCELEAKPDVPGIPGGAEIPRLHEQPRRVAQQADKEGAEKADTVRDRGGLGEKARDHVSPFQRRASARKVRGWRVIVDLMSK